jgi:hypothetical protein
MADAPLIFSQSKLKFPLENHCYFCVIRNGVLKFTKFQVVEIEFRNV